MTDRKKRYCVVTPYYKEERALLVRCMDSVRRQTVAADHLLVADGFPQDWIARQPVRHVALDRAHRDYGDFARGVGALMAVAEKYDGICFLDADNWYDDDHVEGCLAAAAANPAAAYVAAQRRFVRPDGTVMTTVRPAELPNAEHVDTNCFFFLPRAYQFLPRWCTMPQEVSQSGDHLFYLLLTVTGIVPAVVPRPTVNYLCMFEQLYRDNGEEPPPGAKPLLNWQDVQAWINGLTPAELDHVRSLTGLQLFQQERAAA
jgi:glycosyltransferase involved in cell wall biosynthesis